MKTVLWPNKSRKYRLSDRGLLQSYEKKKDIIRADTQALWVSGLPHKSVPGNTGTATHCHSKPGAAVETLLCGCAFVTLMVTIQHETSLLDLVPSYLIGQWPPFCAGLVTFEAAGLVSFEGWL